MGFVTQKSYYIIVYFGYVFFLENRSIFLLLVITFITLQYYFIWNRLKINLSCSLFSRQYYYCCLHLKFKDNNNNSKGVDHYDHTIVTHPKEVNGWLSN